MPTLADLFETCYLTGGSGVEFSAIRLHCRGVDEICRAFGATALSSTPPPKDSDPAITFTAIDDRGQQQQSITFLGTFSRCDDPMPPKQFVSGKTYESCLAYLIPGGGSIQKVQWDNGPAAANEVTPYFDRPIVWG